jgi:probable HAF family extracellular repeat protein
MRRLLFAGAVCSLLVCLATPLRADGQTYTIKNLGTIAGVVPHVTGINASGSVSGWYTAPNAGDRAVRYTEQGGWAQIPGLESLNSYALGINDHGDVVGYAILANGSVRAFRYTDGGSVEFVAPMAGGTYTIASGINNGGEITGYGDTATSTTAFRQSPGLLAQGIDTLGGAFSGGCGINDSGQVAGIALTSIGTQHGFRASTDGTVAEIQGLTGPSSWSSACAIDASGAVTGQAEAGESAQHAFLYSDGSLMDLDAFGSSNSDGVSISGGVVVGNYTLADGVSTHAFKYSATTGSVDLNTILPSGSGWVLAAATGVNTKGAMIGEGTLNGADAVWELAAPVDTTPPTITSLTVSPATIKPNNHMAAVTVSVSATDNVDPQPSCSITSIDAAQADPADMSITGALTASILAVKDSRGTDRTYTITVTCSDASKNASIGQATVLVSAGNGNSGKNNNKKP